jgi:hypothetical protein
MSKDAKAIMAKIEKALDRVGCPVTKHVPQIPKEGGCCGGGEGKEPCDPTNTIMMLDRLVGRPTKKGK